MASWFRACFGGNNDSNGSGVQCDVQCDAPSRNAGAASVNFVPNALNEDSTSPQQALASMPAAASFSRPPLRSAISDIVMSAEAWQKLMSMAAGQTTLSRDGATPSDAQPAAIDGNNPANRMIDNEQHGSILEALGDGRSMKYQERLHAQRATGVTQSIIGITTADEEAGTSPQDWCPTLSGQKHHVDAVAQQTAEPYQQNALPPVASTSPQEAGSSGGGAMSLVQRAAVLELRSLRPKSADSALEDQHNFSKTSGGKKFAKSHSPKWAALGTPNVSVQSSSSAASAVFPPPRFHTGRGNILSSILANRQEAIVAQNRQQLLQNFGQRTNSVSGTISRMRPTSDETQATQSNLYRWQLFASTLQQIQRSNSSSRHALEQRLQRFGRSAVNGCRPQSATSANDEELPSSAPPSRPDLSDIIPRRSSGEAKHRYFHSR